MKISLRRVYDPPRDGEGVRVLVDRLWPRGVRRERLLYDHWFREVAPSPELRKRFGHDPERFTWFRQSYWAELARLAAGEGEGAAALRQLRAMAQDQGVTLLYAAKDPVHNHAVVLREFLLEEAQHVHGSMGSDRKTTGNHDVHGTTGG